MGVEVSRLSLWLSRSTWSALSSSAIVAMWATERPRRSNLQTRMALKYRLRASAHHQVQGRSTPLGP